MGKAGVVRGIGFSNRREGALDSLTGFIENSLRGRIEERWYRSANILANFHFFSDPWMENTLPHTLFALLILYNYKFSKISHGAMNCFVASFAALETCL